MRFIFCIALFISTGLSAQTIDSTKIPFAVRHKYDSVYPTLKDPKWQFNTDSLYVASVYLGGLSKTVYISIGGQIKRVITDIPISKTPQYIRDVLDKKYNSNYQLLSLSADLKYATMAYRDATTQQLKDMQDFKLLDYTIKITVDGKVYTLNYNYNTHQLMDNDKL
jgi:hypothetical protein